MTDKHEQEQKVVINGDDIKNIEDFFNHFGVKMTDGLTKQLEVFRKNPDSYTIADQEQLRVELARAMVESDHELFKDELFENVIKNSQDVWFNAQFDRDLESTLARDDQDSSGSSGEG